MAQSDEISFEINGRFFSGRGQEERESQADIYGGKVAFFLVFPSANILYPYLYQTKSSAYLFRHECFKIQFSSQWAKKRFRS